MGSESGALTYNAQPFWANNRQRGGHHTGDDINGIGGMNSDLGDPVYAIGNGLVIYRGEPSPGWGNVLVLAHRRPKGTIQLSMYAHLQTMIAAYGDIVPRGKIIGTVGTAGNRYPAHLHLEILDHTGVPIGRGYASNPKHHLNPTKTISSFQDRQNNTPAHPSILAIILKENLNSQQGGFSIQQSKE
jgi:murein DD-endopeptidase MepM/ murein hydrolase activator NlpD